MQRPIITDLNISKNDVIFEKDDIVISQKDDKIIISSKKEQRSIIADAEDWYDYGLHVFTPESAQKAVNIMFDYDKILESPDNNVGEEDFNPTVFKVFHKESGFFSRKANKQIDPKKNKDGEWDRSSEGWDPIGGGIWSGQTHAILHIKSMFRFTIRPDLFKTGDEYYAKRDSVISKYGLLAMDNEGRSKTYDAIDLVPKSENHRNWTDFKKWNDLKKEEERLAKQKFRERKKKLEDIKTTS